MVLVYLILIEESVYSDQSKRWVPEARGLFETTEIGRVFTLKGYKTVKKGPLVHLFKLNLS